MENEIWEDIDGYEGLYQISNLGRIKSLPRTITYTVKMETKELIMKPSVSSSGYCGVNLKGIGKVKRLNVHRILAKTFINNKNKKKCVNHKDGNRLNNNLSNLEWVTHSENSKHAYRHNGRIVWNKGIKEEKLL